MASQQATAWWTRDKEAGLSNRIQAIQRYRDPTTNADELLRYAKVFIALLLIFTGILGGVSYFLNFSTAFGPEIAIVMAIALTATIEFGKNYCAKWVLRIPMFQGFGHIIHSPANTISFLALICFGVATFTMSVINSTKGGHQLATMLSNERNAATFTPDTKAIDAEMAELKASIAADRDIKWKGVVTYQAQKSMQSKSKTLATLSAQRAQLSTQQRADWEKTEQQKSSNTSYTAGLVMASGGWVELLQILLMCLLVSCEKQLDAKMAGHATPQGNPGIGFRQQPVPINQNQQPPVSETRNPIGFNVGRDGNVVVSPPPPDPYIRVDNPQVVRPPQNSLQIPPDLANDVELRPTGEILFKQTGELFKQIRNSNHIVIGLEYQGPRMLQPSTMSYTQVTSRLSIYKGRTGKQQMQRLWEFALSLFEIPESA